MNLDEILDEYPILLHYSTYDSKLKDFLIKPFELRASNRHQILCKTGEDVVCFLKPILDIFFGFDVSFSSLDSLKNYTRDGVSDCLGMTRQWKKMVSKINEDGTTNEETHYLRLELKSSKYNKRYLNFTPKNEFYLHPISRYESGCGIHLLSLYSYSILKLNENILWFNYSQVDCKSVSTKEEITLDKTIEENIGYKLIDSDFVKDRIWGICKNSLNKYTQDSFALFPKNPDNGFFLNKEDFEENNYLYIQIAIINNKKRRHYEHPLRYEEFVNDVIKELENESFNRFNYHQMTRKFLIWKECYYSKYIPDEINYLIMKYLC